MLFSQTLCFNINIMKKYFIYLTIIILAFLSCKQENKKLTENYRLIETSLSKATELIYSRDKRFYFDLHYYINSCDSNDNLNDLRHLELNLKRTCDFYDLHADGIEGFRKKNNTNKEIIQFIKNTFKSYKDTLMVYLYQNDTTNYFIIRNIYSFDTIWNLNSYCLDNSLSTKEYNHLLNLNLIKLKFDFLNMALNVNYIYMNRWTIDIPTYDRPKQYIFDDSIINLSETYSAKILNASNISKYADKILINRIEINGIKFNVNYNIKVQDVPEINYKPKIAGKYKYEGYFIYKSPFGDRLIPFERQFKVMDIPQK